jgi:ribosomal protein S18 acetylase RimI-like enzyme
MRLDSAKVGKIQEPILPEGFAFRFFKDGDELNWARIETSVLEFEAEEDARDFFVRNFLIYEDKLKARCIFIVNADGLPIATTTAWFADSELGHQATLHWVAVCPEYQKLGLGKAIVQKALCLFTNLEPNEDIFLHTQTWSYKAIKLYHQFGFNLMKTQKLACLCDNSEGFKIYSNDYTEALEVIKDIIDAKTFEEMISSTK